MARTGPPPTSIVVPQRFHDLMQALPFATDLDELPVDDEPTSALFRAVFAAEADENGDRTVPLTAPQLDELYTVAVTLADGAARSSDPADRDAVSVVMRQVEDADTVSARPINWAVIAGAVVPFAALAMITMRVSPYLAVSVAAAGATFAVVGALSNGRKGASTAAIIGALVVSVAAVAVTTVRVFALDDAGPLSGDHEEQHTVVYEVLGNSTTVDIFYGMFGRESPLPSETAVTVPWRKTVRVTAAAGQETTLVVFIADTHGTVRCVLYVDGVVTDTDDASGQGGIANCAGFVVRPTR